MMRLLASKGKSLNMWSFQAPLRLPIQEFKTDEQESIEYKYTIE